MNVDYRISPLTILMITLGTALYAFGFVNINISSHLAEGGVSGVTLILRSVFGWNPAYTSLLLNIPILLMGWKYFGRKALILTIYGTIALSVFIELFQKIPFTLTLGDDLLIAALLGGVFAGLGLGLVFRYGGTTGGSDVIARIIEHKTGRQVGQSMLILDIIVMLASLIYIDLRHMMYTVIMVFVVSQMIDLVQSGGYTAKGMLIITKEPQKIAQFIMNDLYRGTTYLNAQGAYSQKELQVLYVVLNPQEVNDVKGLLHQIDPEAFISIINVHEVIGEGFTWDVPSKWKLPFKQEKKD